MEQFVKLLYDRLEGKKDLQLQLYVIMQNAINEMVSSLLWPVKQLNSCTIRIPKFG